MHPTQAIATGLIAALAGTALAQHTNTQLANQPMEKVYGCWGDEDGNLEGGVFFLPMDPDAREIIEAIDEANRGVVDNRVDIVIVGDGYTAGEMGQFHTDADGIIASLFQYEPFTSYEPYFRMTKVEVVSAQSGVDNDPSEGIFRNTALDMEYWCFGIERLLCVNVAKAYQAASAAPDIDQVLAIANSSKYGGAGYPSNNLGTVAGQNGSAAQIAIHELGHSLGDLADEYTYGGPTTYTGPELGPVNVSIYTQAQQIADSRKWYDWMGASAAGFDGTIGAYQGGNYSVNGVYRPSNNSMMRALGRRFNLVSAERLIRQIYKEVNPIDDGTPDNATVEPTDTLWVLPMQPLNHDLEVLWYLDGELIAGASQQTTLDLSTLALDSGEHTVRVEVMDPTPWVRDTTIRNIFLSESREFVVQGCSLAADFTGDGALNFFDVSAFLSDFSAGLPNGDFNNDGAWNFFDVSDFLQAFSAGECL